MRSGDGSSETQGQTHEQRPGISSRIITDIQLRAF